MLTLSNKTDDRPCETRAVAHQAPYFLLTGERGIAMQRRQKKKKRIKKEKKDNTAQLLLP